MAKYLILLVLLMSVVGGAYFYYTSTQAKLQEQAAAIAVQGIQIAQQEKVLEQKEADNKQQQELVHRIAKEFRESRNQVEDLRSKFNKTSNLVGQRDIGVLAISKPAPIEKIINKGTSNAQRCVEIASGASRTEQELSATKNSEINNACPDIANPSYIPH